jgi:hypothetical protein
MSNARDNDFGTVFEAEMATINLIRTGDRMTAEVTIRIEEPDDDVLTELFKIAKRPITAIFSVKGIPPQGQHDERANLAHPDPGMRLFG